MSNIYYVLGNGFSIDLVYKMDKQNDIDLNNLFSKGEYVCYPNTNARGFLSRKYTPCLWDIGARTYIASNEALHIITDVITCANVFNLSQDKRPCEERDDSNIYIKAYGELSFYLRYLFIYYDSLVKDEDLIKIKDQVEIIVEIQKEITKGNKIKIITYNYDIFLERLLRLCGISFNIYGFDDDEKDVTIFKPHGSISFSFSIKQQEYAPFVIKYGLSDSIEQKSKSFDVKYDLTNDYPIISAIIPPAGDAGRCNYEWIRDIRTGIESVAKNSTSKDNLIIFGLSYWHVDRNEIDEILLLMDSKIDVRYINPNPPSELEAVLSSLFKNYIHYSSGKLLGGE